MVSTCEDQASRHSQRPSCSGINGSDNAGDFECNICLELAQDPIVTLCGHLFCWPCLHKWLCLHAHSPECPVCKAVVQEDELIPLYGRGKASSDPRSKPVPGVDIPHLSSGMRPEVAPSFPHHGFGSIAGLPTMGAARMGNFGLVSGFGGLFPPLFNLHVQAFTDPTAYGAPAVLPSGFGSFYNGAYPSGYAPPWTTMRQSENSLLATLFLIVGAFVVFALLFA